MAVVIDGQAFGDSLPVEVRQAADALQRAGAVGEVESVNGGAQAAVREERGAFLPWVGVVDQELTRECDCPAPPGDWCGHAAAVALVAIESEIRWSGDASPPSTIEVSDEYAHYLAAVARVPPRQLAELVAAQAVAGRQFAVDLLAAAGMLGAPDRAAFDRFAEVVSAAADVTGRRRWEIRDIELAGQQLVDEAQILGSYPATPEALELIEEALLVWDELAGFLIDAYYLRNIDPDEISGPLVGVHADLCDRLGMDAYEVAKRRDDLIRRCDHDTVDPAAYRELLQ
ncbi:hypothetical protein JQS43_07580 [Natronosporangium hydrolyticum]|uniref:SWIM-type domain-containing protein n=1 Tax=Natronosporangium hydrolyticum TaxID=2811111 RepID=A0A895YLG8_9ACTN|nr:hypothetical protein [Natronosporangium hydrolyticum]QSB16153.1 hypothetical protein JQS43_07580 [Natronosporangium hydrolyticum]